MTASGIFDKPMMSRARRAKIGLASLAWMVVLLAATHRSTESPVVLGRYSLPYICLLGSLIAIAVMLSLAKPAWIENLYQMRTSILIGCASLLLSVSFVELAIRTFDLYGLSYYEAVRHYMRNMEPDEQLIYHHRPSWETRHGDFYVSYNERGLRDRPIARKEDGEFRILALGDSVTFGWGVPQDQIFTSRLEEILQDRLKKRVRVINSSVGGYNTVQELAYFKQEGVTFQPDLVILTYVENDIEENKGPYRHINDSLWEESLPGMVVTMVRKLWLYRLVDFTYRFNLETKGYASEALRRGQGWSDSMSALDELVAKCEEYRIPLMVFFYGLEPKREGSLFQDVGRHVNGPVRDIGEWLGKFDRFSLINSKVDSHPNAEAHRLMAENMAREILNDLAARK